MRRSWRLAVLVPLIPLAIAIVAWTLSRIEPGQQDPVVPIVSTLVAAAMLVGGIVGAVSVPWFRPRMITCTPDGVMLDDRRLPASEIAGCDVRRYQ